MADELQQIRYEVRGPAALVTLCRPDRLNAFTPRMARELIEVADRVDADDRVRGVVVTGEGRAFCAGADLARGGETFDLSFTGMPPSQTLWLFVGISRIDFFPFFGGTLVPNPDFTFLLPTSLGALFLPGQSLPPGIPPGFSIYLHGWMNDPGGPAGAAATNALELITP